jgi:hypothetical protein
MGGESQTHDRCIVHGVIRQPNEWQAGVRFSPGKKYVRKNTLDKALKTKWGYAGPGFTLPDSFERPFFKDAP